MDLKIDKKIKLWLEECKDIIRRNTDYKVDFKTSKTDLVTTADRDIENYLRNQINNNFPSDQILGEEAAYEGKEDISAAENLWVIDPIDGTTNFVVQARDYCTMIAYFENGQAKFSYIYDHYQDKILSAFAGKGVFLDGKKIEKPKNKGLSQSLISLSSDVYRNEDYVKDLAERAMSIRSVGSSGLDGARVCKGEFGAYINPTAAAWDYAPFILMADELDLHISRVNGDDLDLEGEGGYIISSHKVYEEISNIISK